MLRLSGWTVTQPERDPLDRGLAGLSWVVVVAAVGVGPLDGAGMLHPSGDRVKDVRKFHDFPGSTSNRPARGTPRYRTCCRTGVIRFTRMERIWLSINCSYWWPVSLCVFDTCSVCRRGRKAQVCARGGPLGVADRLEFRLLGPVEVWRGPESRRDSRRRPHGWRRAGSLHWRTASDPSQIQRPRECPDFCGWSGDRATCCPGRLSGYPLAVEHGERVEYILPAADSSSDVLPVFQRVANDKIEHFECGLFVREMSSPSYRVPEPGV